MNLSMNIDRAAAIKALSDFPDEVGRGSRLVLKAGVRDIQDRARREHQYTSRSGNLDGSIRGEVSGLSARIFLDTRIAKYGPMQHQGTGFYGPRGHAYRVEPKRGTHLRWVSGGRFVFSRGVTIIGIRPDPFLFRAADAEAPKIAEKFDAMIAKAAKGGG